MKGISWARLVIGTRSIWLLPVERPTAAAAADDDVRWGLTLSAPPAPPPSLDGALAKRMDDWPKAPSTIPSQREKRRQHTHTHAYTQSMSCSRRRGTEVWQFMTGEKGRSRACDITLLKFCFHAYEAWNWNWFLTFSSNGGVWGSRFLRDRNTATNGERENNKKRRNLWTMEDEGIKEQWKMKE